MTLDVDYERLRNYVQDTAAAITAGTKDPVRNPKVRIESRRGLQGRVTAGKHQYCTDAALDAGGFAEHPRPMDYLLGALASCAQMWCLRWAALNQRTIGNLVIEADCAFTWRGEYLGEVDSGMTRLAVTYRVEDPSLTADDLYRMADMVAQRCPVFATLRRAVTIDGNFELNGRPVAGRSWQPDQCER